MNNKKNKTGIVLALSALALIVVVAVATGHNTSTKYNPPINQKFTTDKALIDNYPTNPSINEDILYEYKFEAEKSVQNVYLPKSEEMWIDIDSGISSQIGEVYTVAWAKEEQGVTDEKIQEQVYSYVQAIKDKKSFVEDYEIVYDSGYLYNQEQNTYLLVYIYQKTANESNEAQQKEIGISSITKNETGYMIREASGMLTDNQEDLAVFDSLIQISHPEFSVEKALKN